MSIAEVLGECPRYVVDGNTGAVITELSEGDRIIRRSVMDSLLEDETRMLFSNGQFGKAYSAALSKLAKQNLSQSEYRIVLLFITLVRPSSGLIAYGNYKPVNLDWVAEELQLSDKTVTRSINRLLMFRIICKATSGGDVQYFFNPYIYNKGRYINKTLFEMFKKSEWAKG